jgi:Na+/H+ antiporter NhaC
LICIPALIQVFIKTNSATAFTRIITKKINSPTLVELACCFSSCILSIDDYLSILTVGNVMRSITDHVGIARAKLAYLIHTLSGVLVIMCPISSWVAAICVYLQQSGIDNTNPTALIYADPFLVYIESIPYMVYSLLTVFTVLIIVTKRLSFGPMAAYEKNNQIIQTSAQSEDSGSPWGLVIPLIILLGSTVVGILYCGGFYLFGGTHTLLEAFKSNTQIFLVLAVASIITLLFSLLQALYQRYITMRDVGPIIYSGFHLMRSILIMLFLISILSSFLKNDLATGQYLAAMIKNTATIEYVPAIMFLLSLTMALATGSSWGTFGLLLPIAVPMISSLCNLPALTNPTDIPLLYPVLGAIFSGAVCGDHISLFSETTIMAASCAHISPLVHFKTQLVYALPAIIGSFIAFCLMGVLYVYYIQALYWLSILSAFIVCITILIWLNKKYV